MTDLSPQAQAVLEDIKKEVYSIHLPTVEEDERVMELIEKAFALGWEIGYDYSKNVFGVL